MNHWPLARLFKRLPFTTNFHRRRAYLWTRDLLIKLLSWWTTSLGIFKVGTKNILNEGGAMSGIAEPNIDPPPCCKCGRPITDDQGYGHDRRRRLFWCEDCADQSEPPADEACNEPLPFD